MRTIEAQRIILEILAGRRTLDGKPFRRPRTLLEWDLAKTARSFFRDSGGAYLFPHVEQALFARALQRLTRDGLVRLRARLPGVVLVSATQAGLDALESGLKSDHDPEIPASRPCPRCGYYNPEADKSCALCHETLHVSPAHIARSLSHLANPDIFMSSQMTWLWLRRWGIYVILMAACMASLFLVTFILEGTALIDPYEERVVVAGMTMSLILGIIAGYCIVKIRAGLFSGLIFFTLAYLAESAVRISVGGTTHGLWREAIELHLITGLPLALGFGVLIGKLAEQVAHIHGGGR